MHDLFVNNLKYIDFDPSVEGSNSILLISDINKEGLTPNQIFELEKARKFKATAVYFRLFDDNRSPLPQVYIYDNSQDQFSQSDLAEIHRDLWSNYQIPMYLVVERTEIKIFDCRSPVDVEGSDVKTSPVDILKLASDAVTESEKKEAYSRKLFDTGLFWEQERTKHYFKDDKSAYKLLVKDLKFVRSSFLKFSNLPSKTANKLLVFSILIKYLEERGNEGETLFAKDFFQKLGANNFCDVLRKKGKLISLFQELSNKFNGEIFIWEEKEEENLVASSDLTQLADFLDADIDLDTKQVNLWRKYAFNHLPVELISTVYETFLNERKDAVYTPEFLVSTLVEASMPQNEVDRLSVKSIDVSCGSGIFLVSVFKRLVQRVCYAKFKRTGVLPRLKSNELLRIIKNNIFGVDIEEDAVRLTVFSLCLALCDELTPKEIWTELKFDHTFQTNFKHKNFFEYLDEAEIGTFDLVIGNAPFTKLTVKKDEGEIFYYIDKDKVKLNIEVSQKLSAKRNVFPQNQLALMFLDQSTHLLKENGLQCLITPSASLLYNNSFEFKRSFFPRHQVMQILDFTNLNSILFEAKVPTAAIFVRKQQHNETLPILHITIRRAKSIEEKIFFEIDKYDFHYVSQQAAISDKHVWKCNLLGGGRLVNLVDRFSNMGSIGSHVRNKKKEGWVCNEGYKIGTSKNKRRKLAEFITGKRTVPAEAFSESGIDEKKIIDEFDVTLFHSTGDKKIYEPPHLLIKKEIGESLIPTFFSDEELTFDARTVGIHSPISDREQLYALHESFIVNRDIYKLFITTTSNEFAVVRATSILKQDIMNLPYSEDKEVMNLSYVEQIICDDVLDYQIELLSKGSKAKVNKETTTEELKKYGEVFSKLLNSVYGKSDRSFYLNKIYDWGEFYITEFNYGSETKETDFEKIDELTENLQSIITNEIGRNFHLQRIIRINQRNKFSFIKPKALRYWLRSIAIKDADEVFSGLVKAGY